MIRRHLFALQLLLFVADALVAGTLFLLLGELRFGDAAWNTLWDAMGVEPLQGAALYAVVWVAILGVLGLYTFRGRWTLASQLNDILVAAVVMLFTTMTFLYIVKLDVSRLFLLAVLVTQPIVAVGTRAATRLFFNRLRTRGYNSCYMLVVGAGDDAQAFADAVERHRELGIQVVGHLRAPGEAGATVTRPVLGDAADLVRIFHERVIDEVAVCAGTGTVAAGWAQPIIRFAADEGKHVRVPSPVPPHTFDLQTEELDGLLIRSYVHGPALPIWSASRDPRKMPPMPAATRRMASRARFTTRRTGGRVSAGRASVERPDPAERPDLGAPAVATIAAVTGPMAGSGAGERYREQAGCSAVRQCRACFAASMVHGRASA